MIRIDLNTNEIPDIDFDRAQRIIIAAYYLTAGSRPARSLDEAETTLRDQFGRDVNWYVYRGGHHIALHLQINKVAVRVLTVTER